MVSECSVWSEWTLAVGLEVLAGDGGDEDGLDAGGAGLGDVLAEVDLVVGGAGEGAVAAGGWALWCCCSGCGGWAGEDGVVMAELDEHVVGLGLERALPQSLRAEGAGTGAAFSHVHAVDLGGEIRAETAAVASVVSLGGVADEVDADDGPGLALSGGGGVEGFDGVALRDSRDGRYGSEQACCDGDFGPTNWHGFALDWKSYVKNAD